MRSVLWESLGGGAEVPQDLPPACAVPETDQAKMRNAFYILHNSKFWTIDLLHGTFNLIPYLNLQFELNMSSS